MFSGPSETFPRLLGDIGGTNARFALIREPGAPITDLRNLACADFPGPLEAIQRYLADTRCTARQAAAGIANPVTGDWLQMTNNHWAFSVESVKQALNLDQLVFINDFTALALSLPHLSPEELRSIGGGTAAPSAAIGVIGPGTGLGVSGLVPSPSGWIPLQGEGGHVSLSPQTEEEMAVTQQLLQEFGHVSAERILSGPGLTSLHLALARIRSKPVDELNASQITEAAICGLDSLCVDTLAMFCALLGSTAGNLALTLGARGGIFIGGGIIPRLGKFFDQSPFRARFEAKGRFQKYLEAIPTQLITAANPALTGAAAALDSQI